MNGKKNSKAFTLVEIVVVIAVIGILAAVLVPSFVSILSRSKINDHYERVTSVRDEYFFDNDDFSALSDMRGYLFIIDDEVYEVSITGEINKSDYAYEEYDVDGEDSPYERVDYSSADSSVIIYSQTAVNAIDRAARARDHYHDKNGLKTEDGKKIFYEMNHYIITVYDNDSEQDINFEVTYGQNPDGSTDFSKNGLLVLTDKTIEGLAEEGLYYTAPSGDLDTWAGVVYAPTEETKLFNRILELEDNLADEMVWDDIVLGFDGGNVKQSNYVYCVETGSGISFTSTGSQVTRGRLYTIDPDGKVYSLGDTMLSDIKREGYRFLTTNEIDEEEILTKVKATNQGELRYARIDCYAIFYGYYNDDTSYADDGYHLWTDFLYKYNGGSSTNTINYNASMSSYSIKRLVISDEITTIGNGAFTNYNDLTEVIIPESLTTIEVTTQNPFANGKIDYVVVNDRNTVYAGYKDSGIIDIEENKVVMGTNGILDNVIYLPEGIEKVGDYAFEKSGLAQINVVGIEIGVGAFKDCTSLVNVSHDLIEIPDELFSGCTSLRLISELTSVISIGNEAFKGCICVNDEDDSEPSLSFTTELGTIGTNAFYNNNIKLYYSSSKKTFRTSVTGYENTNHLTIEYALKDITYDLQGGVVTGTNPDIYDPASNEELYLNSPAKDGYIFISWGVFATDNTSEVFDDIVAGESLAHPYVFTQGETYNNKDVTLTAQYERVVFDIIYMINGEDITSTIGNDYPKSFSKLSTDEMYILDMSRDYYDFDGWYVGDTLIGNWFNPYGRTENAIINANFLPHEYSITYYYNGGEADNPTTYTISTETFTLVHPVRQDYTFDNWNNATDNVNAVDITITQGEPPKNLVIHAIYHATVYTISYDFKWGEIPLLNVTEEDPSSPISFTVENGTLLIPDPLEATGYDFDRWYVGNEVLTNARFICANYHDDVTLTARFTPWQYTITYANGDVNNSGIGKEGVISNYNNATTYYYGQDFTLNEPAMVSGYRFLSWSGIGTAASWVVGDPATGFIIHNATANMIIKANWELIVYDINYVHPEGTTEGPTPNPISYTVEDDPITLNAVNRTGYIFSGWTGSNGNSPQLTVVIVCAETFAAKTYYSNWVTQDYTITYNNLLNSTPTGGGNPATYTIEDDTFTLNNPERRGYTFTGWTGTNLSEANTTVTITKGSTGNRTYNATWEAIVYSITYDLNDGDNDAENKSEYTIEYEDFPVKEAERLGYEFLGWTGTDLDEPTTTFEIEQGTIGDKVYEAQWEIINYTITYILKKGGEEFPANPTVLPANPVTYTVEDDEFTLTNPIGLGYTFTGWSGTGLGDGDSKSMTVTIAEGSTGNREYTAHWTLDEYTIQYDLDDGELGEGEENPTRYTVEDDSVTLYNPTKVGYNFLGWTGGGYAVPQATVTITKGVTVGDKTFVANYDPIVYNLTVNLFDGTVSPAIPSTYTIETPAITFNIPTKLGYRFDGWTGTGFDEPQDTFVLNLGRIGDRSYNANWTLINYSIIYNLRGGSVDGTNPTTYTVNSADITLINPTKLGYTFDGWSGTGVEDPYLVTIPSGSTENRTYTANWTLIYYQVKYQYAGGSVSPAVAAGLTSISVESSPFTLVNPTRRGYTFAGWTDDYHDEEPYDNDGYTPTLSVPSLSVTVIPSSSIGSRIYTANWNIIVYTINYDMDQGEFADTYPTTYTVESGTVSIPVPVKTYYRFDGWTGSGYAEPEKTVIFNTAEVTLEDKGYTAHWTLMRFNILYHVTYEEDGDTLTGFSGENGFPAINEDPLTFFPTEYYSDNDSFIIDNPTKTGYNFAGWQEFNPGTDVTKGDKRITVTINHGDTNDKEFGATWTLVEYTIVYNYNNGGLTSGSNPTRYTIESDEITLINPVRVGYTFDGWTGTDMPNASTTVVIGTGSYGNRVYTANWTPKTYAVKIDPCNDGAPGATTGTTEIIATYDQPMPSITVAARTGYTLTGYEHAYDKYYNGNGTSARNWDQDLTAEEQYDEELRWTLYAQWSPNPYNVTLNQQSGSGGTASVTAIYDSPMPSASAPSRTGYTFGGYYTAVSGGGDQYYTSGMGSARNWDIANATTLYAKWTAISYTISYNLDGGSASNPASYTIETNTFTLTNPTKSGYNFDGWSGTGISGKSTSVTISKGSTGNRNYTAHWSYAVGDGGDGADHEFMCSGKVNNDGYPDHFRTVWRRSHSSGSNWRRISISCIVYNPDYTSGYNYIEARRIQINGSNIYSTSSLLDSSCNGGKGPKHGYTFMSTTYDFPQANGQHTITIAAAGSFYYYNTYNVSGSASYTFGFF